MDENRAILVVSIGRSMLRRLDEVRRIWNKTRDQAVAEAIMDWLCNATREQQTVAVVSR